MLLMLSLVAGLGGQAAAPPFTLADAIARARQASPVREAAVQLAAGADEAARQAGRLPNPQFDFRIENLWPSGPGLSKDVFAVVNLPVELGGKRRLRRDLGAADQRLAATHVGATDWALVARVTGAYLDALRARRRVEILEASRADLTTAVTVMARRLEEGLVAEADVLKVRADRARVELDLARARLEQDQRAIDLTYLTGAAAPVEPATLAEPIVPPPVREPAAIAGLVARHPEVQAARARVARGREVLSLERARRTPDAMVTGGYKRTAGFDSGVAAVVMTLPLFDRNGVAVARAGGDLRGAEAEEAALSRRLAAEVTSTSLGARAIADRAASVTAELVRPAEQVRAAAAAALAEGEVDILRLLDAERVLRDARHLEIDARLDAVAAAIAARMAAGEEPLP